MQPTTKREKHHSHPTPKHRYIKNVRQITSRNLPHLTLNKPYFFRKSLPRASTTNLLQTNGNEKQRNKLLTVRAHSLPSNHSNSSDSNKESLLISFYIL